MKALALTAVLVAIAGPALPRAAGFDSPGYGGIHGGTYYADADPTIGSGDTQYDFWSLVHSTSPSLRHWAMRNPSLVDRSKIISRQEAIRRYGPAAMRPRPRPSSICGGCTAPSDYDYNRNLLPIRDGAPAPRLPCGDEILVWFPGLDVSSPALFGWMKAQPCGI